jgi:hypothetical protein
MAMKILVNKYEEITHARLVAACSADGAHVCPKVRVKDALPLEGSGIPGEQFSFGLRSHFDFIVADKEWVPLFAVEFDGASHQTSSAKQRDALKNSLCENFKLPLLRVKAVHLERKFRQWDLLSYFIETWFLGRAFYDAQEKGLVPWDEDFDPLMIISDGTGNSWPYWFAAPSQLDIRRLHNDGRVAHATASYLTAYDSTGNCHCVAFLKISADEWAVTRTGMRSQSFDVCISEVAWQIAIVELRDKLVDILAARARPFTYAEVDGVVRRFCGKFGQLCSFGGILEPPLSVHRPV